VTEQIGWCVELEIQPGRLDSFLALTTEMVDKTAKEAGVLTYQRFISDDGMVCRGAIREQRRRRPSSTNVPRQIR